MKTLFLIAAMVISCLASAQTVHEDTVKGMYYMNIEPVSCVFTELPADRLYVYAGDQLTKSVSVKWELGYCGAPYTWAHILLSGTVTLSGEDFVTYQAMTEPNKRAYLFPFVAASFRNPLTLVD
jgi:hypothetical protein